MTRVHVSSVLVFVLALCTVACGGGSAATTGVQPILTEVTPASGGTAGGTPITIKGANLSNPQPGIFELLIGGLPAENVVVVDGQTVECDTPPHAAGACDITIRNLHGEGSASGAYTYNPAPTIASIDPPEGTRLGGTFVTLTGTGFQENEPGETVAMIGDKELSEIVVVNDTTLTGLTPTSWVEIAKDVKVVNRNGSAKLPNGYTYTGPTPLIYSVSPTTGPAAGGTNVTITGEYFTIAAGTIRVYFGSAQASNVTRVDDQTLTCKTPAGPPFFVDVRVSNANGESSLTDGFYYIPPPPTIGSVTPNQGFVMGGEALTITGTGFVNYSAGTNVVTIGGATPSNIVVVNDTTITCNAPSRATAGTVHIVVSNNNGVATAYNAYTYITPPLWVANGGCSGNYTLSKVDPITLAATTIGTGNGTITGLAFHPTTGVLYGWGDCCNSGLYTFNTTTGAKSSIGGGGPCIGDITFSGNTLLGFETGWWVGPGPVTINLSNGSITLIASTSYYAYGHGFAADTSGNAYFAYGTSLYRVNTSTGSMSYVGSMTLTNWRCSAMTFHLGQLYGVDGGGWGSASLVKINTSNGSTTSVGSLPSGVDAIASQFPAAPGP